jgi:multiple sugar transport system substrate-binding protein
LGGNRVTSTKTDFNVDYVLHYTSLLCVKKLVMITIVALVMSCGGSGDDAKIRLTFWQFWTSPDVKPTVESLIAEYEQAHPEIEIDLVDLTWSDGHEKIVVAFSTGSAPDIVESSDLMMWEPATVDGKVYAVPWLLGTRVLFYNKDLLEQAGILTEEAPRTWDQLLDCSKQISNLELGVPVYGFGSNSAERHRLYKKFLPFLWSNGGAILSEDGTVSLLDQPEAIVALEYYVSLSDAGYMESQRGLDDKFLAGELGFIISGDWLLRRIAKQPPQFDVGTALIPTPDTSDVSVSFAGGEYLTLNSQSKQKREALEFISYLAAEDADYDFCSAVGSPTPANRGAASRILSEADSLSVTFLRQIETARTPPVHPEWVHLEEILEKAVEKAVYHKGNPASALGIAKSEIDKLLAK